LVDEWQFWQDGPGSIDESAVVTATESLSAGSHTYELKARSENGTRTAKATHTKLTVMEF